jgi:uncharacterized phage-associated protein
MSYDNVKLAYVVLKTYDQVQNESDDKMAKYFYKMTNLKLQKLSYFVYGLNLNDKTIDPEFKKWKFGPVMEDVYYQVRSIDAGGFNISFEKYKDYVKTNFSDKYTEIKKFADAKATEIKESIEKLWQKNAFDMVEKSHQTDPWVDAKESTIIKNDVIINYFRNKKIEDIFADN